MIVRTAKYSDAADLAVILNEIIAIGGTTAHLMPVSEAIITEWMNHDPDASNWVLAEQDGAVIGFQFAEPHSQLPADAADVASFVKPGITGQGIGRALFSATCDACRNLGYKWINATIRADNQSGLTYYSAMGFKDWHNDPTATLSDGRVTGKISKRFDL